MGELKEKTHDPIWRPGGPVGPLNPDHMRPGWGVPSTLQTPNDWREAGRALHAGVEEQRHGVLTHRLEDVLIRNPLGHPMWRESTTPMAKKLAARLRKMPTGAIQERTVHQSAPATHADTHEAATNHRRGGLGVAGFEGVVREAIHQARCTDEQPEEPPSPRPHAKLPLASRARLHPIGTRRRKQRTRQMKGYGHRQLASVGDGKVLDGRRQRRSLLPELSSIHLLPMLPKSRDLFMILRNHTSTRLGGCLTQPSSSIKTARAARNSQGLSITRSPLKSDCTTVGSRKLKTSHEPKVACNAMSDEASL